MPLEKQNIIDIFDLISKFYDSFLAMIGKQMCNKKLNTCVLTVYLLL